MPHNPNFVPPRSAEATNAALKPSRYHTSIVELAQAEGRAAGKGGDFRDSSTGLIRACIPPDAACIARTETALGHSLSEDEALTFRVAFRLSHDIVVTERAVQAHECRFAHTGRMPAHLRPSYNAAALNVN